MVSKETIEYTGKNHKLSLFSAFQPGDERGPSLVCEVCKSRGRLAQVLAGSMGPWTLLGFYPTDITGFI